MLKFYEVEICLECKRLIQNETDKENCLFVCCEPLDELTLYSEFWKHGIKPILSICDECGIKEGLIKNNAYFKDNF